MARKRTNPPATPKPGTTPPTPDKPATPLYRRAWVLLAALGTVLGAVLANGPTYIENAEKMPSMVERVTNKFQSWLYEDARWDGFYGTSPEAYADIEDMKLSEADMGLHLMVERGHVGGEITARGICKVAPLSHYFLLDGEVGMGGKKASIIAFDIREGKRVNYFRFTAVRDGPVLTIAHSEGPKDWMPKPLRVAHYPNLTGEDAIYKVMLDFCNPEREALFGALKKLRDAEKDAAASPPTGKGDVAPAGKN